MSAVALDIKLSHNIFMLEVKLPGDMYKLHIISGLLFISSLFVSCAPGVNPADAFPIATNQSWKMLATDSSKGINFQDDFRIGNDFKVDRGYTLVSVQSNKFGGIAAFDPKNNLMNITLFMDSSNSISLAKVMSRFILTDSTRAAIYVGSAYFGTIDQVTDQIGKTNSGMCLATRADSMLSSSKRLAAQDFSAIKPALEKLENLALEYAQHKQ